MGKRTNAKILTRIQRKFAKEQKYGKKEAKNFVNTPVPSVKLIKN